MTIAATNQSDPFRYFRPANREVPMSSISRAVLEGETTGAVLRVRFASSLNVHRQWVQIAENTAPRGHW